MACVCFAKSVLRCACARIVPTDPVALNQSEYYVLAAAVGHALGPNDPMLGQLYVNAGYLFCVCVRACVADVFVYAHNLFVCSLVCVCFHSGFVHVHLAVCVPMSPYPRACVCSLSCIRLLSDPERYGNPELAEQEFRKATLSQSPHGECVCASRDRSVCICKFVFRVCKNVFMSRLQRCGLGTAISLCCTPSTVCLTTPCKRWRCVRVRVCSRVVPGHALVHAYASCCCVCLSFPRARGRAGRRRYWHVSNTHRRTWRGSGSLLVRKGVRMTESVESCCVCVCASVSLFVYLVVSV